MSECLHFKMTTGGSARPVGTVTYCSFCEAEKVKRENLLPRDERFAITEPDPQTGARYLFLSKYKAVATRETIVVSDSVNVDLDENGDVIGVEILS